MRSSQLFTGRVRDPGSPELFFFSSRRRHTRFDCDWSSDVCSSDLKDILRFHAVIWPAMLLANGLPLPGRIAANGWLMVGGEKMSKSNLTGISPEALT